MESLILNIFQLFSDEYDAKKTINPCFGRAVEGSFLSKAGPKRGYFSYLITFRVILHKSDVSFLIIAIRYDNHPLFGPALDKNKPSTARPKQGFFFGQKSVDLFFSITYCVQ